MNFTRAIYLINHTRCGKSGTFVSGDKRCRVYCDQPVESRTSERLQFKGGTAVLARGGVSGGEYGHLVILWPNPKKNGRTSYTGMDNGRKTA